VIVTCASQVTMTVTAQLVHRCPFRDEIDEGTAEITWTTAGDTIEIHGLVDWLDSFAEEVVSHEALTSHIADCLGEMDGITDVQVITRWNTAGAEVATRAVPRERLIGTGA
jgi:NADPH-dependent 7-cyano-7-deazaguanine reductase QueF